MPPSRPPTPKPRSRLKRVVGALPEGGVLAAAVASLVLMCSVPRTSSLGDGNPASTAFIELRRGQAAAANKKWNLRWDWRRLGQISRYLRAAVVFSEDAEFYEHDGVEWSAIWHALRHDVGSSGTIGGSTITQQLAKNLYLSPARSMLRKAREMMIAYSLEDHLSKQRILELYLNVVEWGDGIFGAEAAARAWFGCSAAALSPAQAARLAIALPNPYTRAPNVRSAELTQKAVRLIRLFRMEGLVDAAQERAALDDVGADGERVIPDASLPAAPVAPATAAPAAPAAPTPPPAQPTEPAPAPPPSEPGPVTSPP